MTRPARITVDVDALRHNHRVLRRLHGGRLLAVLKANAYGHGAVACARALAEADGFAVAFGGEATALRAAGVRAPVLVLEGVFSVAELHTALLESWWIVVHHEEQLAMIESSSLPLGSLHVWLKLDSGMHRCGFAPNAFRAAHARLMATGKLSSITLMSHFARADECDSAFTAEQISRFDSAVAGLPGPYSLANSAGVLSWPAARRDWARCGIALYGAGAGPQTGLRPVMRVSSEIVAMREIAAGEPVGYGGRFVATRPTRVGLVAFGYADGYPRSTPDGTPLAVDGHRVPLVGRVSMDMLTVDLTELPSARVGSEVELWGRDVSVDDVAQRAGTIAYELLCNAKRAPKRYVGL
ncbi:alanine racemase [Piscinibacter sp. XHJ-5]|uniref:alanine racemase n=1 Tax=Piscinibacter sp. XHJ-5 TaxID=3037797 RepID=UPI0024529DC3|nr:alanine racemase [Piscinibacter sp. XHJ-5]